MFKIFIGWDKRDSEAAELCKYTLQKKSTYPAPIELLDETFLQQNKLPFQKTDECLGLWSQSKFFVPYLCQYQNWAIYVDPGFIWLYDIRFLMQQLNHDKAVLVVKHGKQKLTTGTVFDDQPAATGTKVNWSNLILWNCAHPSNAKLTVDFVKSQPGQWLQKFSWLKDDEVGEIDASWAWLSGQYTETTTKYETPIKAINYHEGGPWLDNWKAVPYGFYFADAKNSLAEHQKIVPAPSEFDLVPDNVKEIYSSIIKYRIDPDNQYYKVNLESIGMAIKNLNNNAVVAVEADSVDEASNKLEVKGQDYDPFLKSFILGSGGQISVWSKVETSKTPVVVRGVTKRKHINACIEQNRDYYYIDTGYFGNGRKKLYHRITKNNMQYLGPVVHRPRDRLAATGWSARKFRLGKRILLAPPSQKLLMCYDIDLDKWMEDTISMLKVYTDREIVVRSKQSRSVRQSSDTMEMALEKDIHCLVTFSSIAAVEAVMFGKPAIVLGPSAAAPVCSTNLADIENPKIPTLDEVEEWAAHLAYCQFTEAEMRNGTAWKILQDSNE